MIMKQIFGASETAV